MKSLELKIPPVALVFIFVGLIWVLGSYLPVYHISFFFGKLWAAILVAILGVVIAISGVVSFRRAKTTVNPIHPEQASNVVTTGIYQFTRNPMYLGMLLVLLGWALPFQSLSAFLSLPAFIWYMTRFQIKPEERALTELFGQEYRDYLTKVRRWI